MNFNLDRNEIDLVTSQIEEIIRLYGIPIKILLTEKENKDLVFGSFSHLSSDKYIEMYAMPENAEQFEEFEKLQTQFGLPGDGTLNLFLGRTTFNCQIQKSFNYQNDVDLNEDLYKKLISSIVVIPSGKMFEITDIVLDNPGLGSTFLSASMKTCYMIRLRTFVPNRATLNNINVDPVVKDYDLNVVKGIPLSSDPVDNLTNYFDELTKTNEKQKEDSKKYSTQDDIFGRF